MSGPRQVGTYPSQRAARAAATKAVSTGDAPTSRETLAWLLDRWLASKTDVTPKTKVSYEWAAGHLTAGPRQVTIDRLDRDDIGRWLDEAAAAGKQRRMVREIHPRVTKVGVRILRRRVSERGLG